MRKIIQIAATEAGAENGHSQSLIALCDDGEVFMLDLIEAYGNSIGNSQFAPKWQRIPRIPKD